MKSQTNRITVASLATAGLLVVGSVAGLPALAQSGSTSQGDQSGSMNQGAQGGSINAPMVGGAPMMPSMTIVENASKANNLTTLVSAVKQAGLVETLSGPGPFTVFAPTNSAFEKLPSGTVDKLMQAGMQSQLKNILTYHVVPGRLTAQDLMAKAKEGGAAANLKTVSGDTLTVKMDGGKLVIIDESGGGASVATADVMQSNGVVHVIESVLMPKA